jgi:hypothetical protein
VSRAENAVRLYAGVLTSLIFPVLLGAIGAADFVIRSISEQIKTITFFTGSPVRHIMRATLGALAGFVVGLFSNLPAQINLPPLALAFLAGYGIEALFSMFDGFKQSSRPSKIRDPIARIVDLKDANARAVVDCSELI